MAVRATESEKLMEHIWSETLLAKYSGFLGFFFFSDLWMVGKNQKKEKA